MTAPKKTESNHLTRKQREAIPHLIGARSLEEGRKHAKVSKSALFSWMKQDLFREELKEAREVMIQEAMERLKTSVTGAVDRLVSLLTAESESVQLRSAEAILNLFLRSKEIEELGDRLTQVEKIVLERKTHG